MKLIDFKAVYGHTWKIERLEKGYKLTHLPTGKVSVGAIRTQMMACKIVNDKSALDNPALFCVPQEGKE